MVDGEIHKEFSRSTPVVILCGGEGTRFREETQLRPKPLIEIGGIPVLWHVMNHYACFGYKRFILCLGYRGEMIKEFFLNHERRTRDFTLDLSSNSTQFHGSAPEADWKVTFVETGPSTMTGGRIKRVQKHIETKHFMLTYADGLANICLESLVRFHLSHGKIGTVTGVQPNAQFGNLETDGDEVIGFHEKPKQENFINGGFFVFRREFLSYLSDSEDCVFERAPLETLSSDRQFRIYRHRGFWQCMDTYKDFRVLNDLWSDGGAPWLLDSSQG